MAYMILSSFVVKTKEMDLYSDLRKGDTETPKRQAFRSVPCLIGPPNSM